MFLAFNRKLSKIFDSSASDKSTLLLFERIKELNQTMDSRLSESDKKIQIHMGQSHQIIRDVTDRLSRMDETTKQVAGYASQLQQLQDILKNPKQRGILGEYFLETLLKNVLPQDVFELQFKLGRDDNGKDLIVDAVILYEGKYIPVDSKLSLEKYNKILEETDEEIKSDLEKQFKQDLQDRIDEAAKYVRPDLGTMSFALMFLPAEGIYYDILINEGGAVKINTRGLLEYAFRKHVIIVSPTSFYAYLQTVIQGLRAIKFAKDTEEIKKNVELLQKHLQAYNDHFMRLGNQINTVTRTYGSASNELQKIDKDMVKITGNDKVIEIVQIDEPKDIIK